MSRILRRRKSRKKDLGYAAAIFGGICWGFSGCCGQFLFQQKGGTAEWLVSLRLLFAGLILISLAFLTEGRSCTRVFRNRKDRTGLLIFTFAGILLSQYTYFAAIQHSNAGTATVLQYLFPIIVLLLVCFDERRGPDVTESAAMILSLAGTVVLGTHGDFTSLQISPAALFFGLAAAAAAVFYNMLSGELIRRYGLFSIAGFGMLIAGLVMTAAVRPWQCGVQCDAGTVLALAGVIVVGTAAGFGLYLWGVSVIGPLKGSLLSSVEPAVAVLLSFFWLKTPFVWIDFLGFGMILGAVLILGMKNAK